MIWVDRIAKKLENSHQHVDDMFTPSGYAHMGSLRGPILHDVVTKVLGHKNKNIEFTYIFNDFDVIDGLPPNLEKEFSKYLGYCLRLVPSPDKKYKNFAEFFTEDFKHVLESLGLKAKYLSSWDMYHEGKFNNVIKLALDNKEKILEVYKNVAGYGKKTDDWHPLQVICPKCNKMGTTKVTAWDGKVVTFTCEPTLVTWAKGCGYTGTISPFDGNGKLPWKVDWPAHWKVLGITFEGAGKDHASKGGSYDIAFELCKEVFDYPKPFYFPYEFFLFGGKKMSSSKGIGLKARDLTKILPPDLARFLIVRLSPEKTLEFSPEGNSIPNLFDEYDRCMQAYFLRLENKIPEKKEGEVLLDFARIMELSEVRPLPQKRILLPRFRTIVNLIESKTDLLAFFEKQKGAKLDSVEKELLEERELFAQVYLKNYATNSTAAVNNGSSQQTKNINLSTKQKEFLKNLSTDLARKKPKTRDAIQTIVFAVMKTSNIKPKEAFQAFYLTLTGKSFGPKAADLILEMGIEKVVDQLTLITNTKATNYKSAQESTALFPDLTDKNIFSIDKAFAQKYPSVNIGIAIIKGVKIGKSNEQLDKETAEFLKSQENLTTEILGTYPEVKSYRRLYKETGVDWHSRRPSPEALLRRIALKKGLYKINTCVDAYNLVVMKHRVSSGAFDMDKIVFPTVLRFPKPGEEILLLGDDQPTKYEPTEIAYFDQNGGYNIDFNYRDSQQTAVTEQTKNLLINIDGVYDITSEMVERTLRETIDAIIKYCGGKLEFAGIASAEKVI